jgi:hypothetical protein
MSAIDGPDRVAIELWLQWKLEGHRSFRFSYDRLRKWWNVKPWVIRRALKKFERRGCIAVCRKAGSRAVVTILIPKKE